MPVAAHLRAAIGDLVKCLVRREFELLEADGRAGRLSALEIRRAIDDYGRSLAPLPNEAFELADGFSIEGAMGKWAVDLPLWTQEEGRSDLMLSMTAWDRDGTIAVEIDDIRVP